MLQIIDDEAVINCVEQTPQMRGSLKWTIANFAGDIGEITGLNERNRYLDKFGIVTGECYMNVQKKCTFLVLCAALGNKS